MPLMDTLDPYLQRNAFDATTALFDSRGNSRRPIAKVGDRHNSGNWLAVPRYG